jgi:outer membrane protein TolC
MLFLTAGLNAVAGPEAILSWEDCLREAKQNHPDLRAAEEKVNQARAAKAITKSGSLPQVSSGLSAKTAKSTAGTTADAYSCDITGRQLLFDGFKTIYDISSDREDIKAAQYSYEAASSDVRLSLREAFVELLKAQAFLDITEKISARRRKNVELVSLRYQAGREHKGSLLNAQANSAQAEFEVAQAGRNIDLAQRQLIKELGRTSFAPIKVEGDLKSGYASRVKPDFEALAQTNPLLLKSIAQKEGAAFEVKSAQADFFPEVYASASAGKSAGHWPPDNDVWSAGVTLSLPVFEGGSRRATVSRARSSLNEALAEEQSTRDSLIFTLSQSWKQWQDAVDKVKVEQKFLEAAEERSKITQAQYSIGLISFDDWSIIEDNLVNAQKSFLNAGADALIKKAGWIQVQGGTLDYVEQ